MEGTPVSVVKKLDAVASSPDVWGACEGSASGARA